MPSAAEIKWLTEYVDVQPGDDVQRVSSRPQRRIEIVEPDPAWPAQFAQVATLIRDALGPAALTIQHVGSTSVADLPAKPIIDVNLVVADPTAEDAYVPALESAGFQFLYREPRWYEHRFFGLTEPYTNLHVFGPEAAEPKRHALFRDWLRAHPNDRAKYAAVKREAAAASRAADETIYEYNARKHEGLQEILGRVFQAHGLVIPPDEEGQK